MERHRSLEGEMNQPLDVSIQSFLKIRLQPVAEELAANGADNLVIGFIPSKGIIHTCGTAEAGSAEYAQQLRNLAAGLNYHADEAERKSKPDSGLILPT